MVVALDTIRKYAPAVIFHPNEKQFPCTIDYFIQDSTLKYRVWSYGAKVGKQYSTVPTLALFKGDIWMVYPASNGTQLLVTRSGDNGSHWDVPRKINGQSSDVAAMTVFQDKLWIIYSDDNNSGQLWVSCSSNGWDWEKARKVSGQKASVPAITTYNGQLHMVYKSWNSNQLLHTRSTNGWDWGTVDKIDGQGSDAPALAILGEDLVMIYSESTGTGKLHSFFYNSSKGWYKTNVMNQFSKQIALTVCSGWLLMTYRDINSPQLWCSRSKNAVDWHDIQPIDGQTCGWTPALVTNGNSVTMVYAGTDSDKQLYYSTNSNGDFAQRRDIPNPSQRDLYVNWQSSWYLDMKGPRDNKLKDATTIYYNTQQKDGKLHIHYIFFYQFQYGQTVRALRAGTEFNAVLSDLGSHQGDIERLEVVLKPDNTGNYTVQSVVFEAHGKPKEFLPNQIDWQETTHPICSVGLNTHGIWNQHVETNPVSIPGETIKVDGIALVTDFLGDRSNIWLAYKMASFVQIGIQPSTGEPINDQLWTKFAGNFGSSYPTSLKGATYFNGKNLASADWTFVKIVEGAGRLLNLITGDRYLSGGTAGVGGRDWIITS